MTDAILILNAIAWSIGAILMAIGGIYIAFEVSTWAIERILRNLRIYTLFVRFMGEQLQRKRAAKELEGGK